MKKWFYLGAVLLFIGCSMKGPMGPAGPGTLKLYTGTLEPVYYDSSAYCWVLPISDGIPDTSDVSCYVRIGPYSYWTEPVEGWYYGKASVRIVDELEWNPNYNGYQYKITVVTN